MLYGCYSGLHSAVNIKNTKRIMTKKDSGNEDK